MRLANHRPLTRTAHSGATKGGGGEIWAVEFMEVEVTV